MNTTYELWEIFKLVANYSNFLNQNLPTGVQTGPSDHCPLASHVICAVPPLYPSSHVTWTVARYVVSGIGSGDTVASDTDGVPQSEYIYMVCKCQIKFSIKVLG